MGRRTFHRRHVLGELPDTFAPAAAGIAVVFGAGHQMAVECAVQLGTDQGQATLGAVLGRSCLDQSLLYVLEHVAVGIAGRQQAFDGLLWCGRRRAMQQA